MFGPLKTSDKGKKMVLCMTDAFTKYVELVALTDKEAERQSSTDGSAGMELLWKLYLTTAKNSGINLQQNYTSDWTLSTPQQQPTTRNATLKQKYATKPLPSISTLLSTNLHWIGSNIWRQWPSHTTPACTDPSRPLHIS